MSSAPRILRVVPHGPVTRPEHSLPVFAVVRWADGENEEVPAIAVAWTREAVQIEWEAPGQGLRFDWVPARDIRRAGTKRPAVDDSPPRSVAGKKNRW
ncbi:hypothetical protein ACIB24_09365 [Spongisporangium articulatum]|uniref:Uncharacterized protein n=1 Tax=Spongisporangium articulatum TaxID=3362603 RepID=A0ABW8ALM1_9ACTN